MYNDAEELLQKVLVSRERTLGRKHKLTLLSIHSLADLLINLGKYEEAKEMLE